MKENDIRVVWKILIIVTLVFTILSQTILWSERDNIVNPLRNYHAECVASHTETQYYRTVISPINECHLVNGSHVIQCNQLGEYNISPIQNTTVIICDKQGLFANEVIQ